MLTLRLELNLVQKSDLFSLKEKSNEVTKYQNDKNQQILQKHGTIKSLPTIISGKTVKQRSGF